MLSGDTIAAVATAPGRGGVAVVRVSGPDAFRIATVVTGHVTEASQAGRFFHVHFRSSSQLLDDGLLLVSAAPRSYTGEDVVELQCHGGAVVPRRVLEACLAAGARLARRGEFTERAFLNGRLDLGEAEAVIDLVDAKTDRAADDAAARLTGSASKPFEQLYAQSIELSSQIEHALDFSEEELPQDFGERLLAELDAVLGSVRRQLSTAREGRLLREGALVVLAGEPNAGKSSLMNALLGEKRAIVSATEGTTRDSIEEGIVLGGWPVRLVDTAGLRTTGDLIEAEGVERAEELIAQADIVLRLIPPGIAASVSCATSVSPVVPITSTHLIPPSVLDSPVVTATSAVAAMSAVAVPPADVHVGEKEIVVRTKCDLFADRAGLCVSAQSGEGLDALKAVIVARLAEISAKSDEAMGADVTTRQCECLLAAEKAFNAARAALLAPDWVVAANELRTAAESVGRILGKVYSDDLLDALFSRFCVGK